MKVSILKISLCSLVCSIMGISVYAQGCNHIVRGTVTESETNASIPYAEVLIQELNKGTVTDEKGDFRFENICNGTFTLIVRHIECKHETRQISVSDEGLIINFALHHDEKSLGEITVSAQAIEAQNAQANSTLSGKSLENSRGESLGETLKNLPGVTSLNTGASVSKPVIQGMHSNRILIFNNGVRQEGQQWGLDHAPEIDAFTGDKLTVIKGAGSVQYGADAIGGIILVEPKLLPQKKGIQGEWHSAFFSNGRIGVTSLSLENCPSCNKNNNEFAWRVQGSLKKGGNLKTPTYYLANTGIGEENLSAALQFKTKKVKNSIYFSRFHSKIGIFAGAHIGNLDDLKNAFSASEPLIKADFTYTLGRPLQRVTHDLLKWKSNFQTGKHHKIITQVSLQRNQRGEFDAHRLFGTLPNNLNQPNLDFNLLSGNANAIFEHQLSQNIHGKIGIDYTYQNNRTQRGALIPNYVSINSGAFLIERWHRFDSKFEIESGLRYDYKWLNVAVRKQIAEEEGKLQQFDFQSFAGQLGFIYHFGESLNISVNSGTSWRAPSVNELFSLGVHHGTASFERGNTELQTERALNNTLSLKYAGKSWSTQIDAYANFIQNYIYLRPDSVAIQTIRGAFPAFNFTQTNAQIIGFDWISTFYLTKKLSLEQKGSVLRGKNTSQSEWLILMPANRTQTNIKYQFDYKSLKNNYVSINSLFVAAQSRVPINQDYTPPPAAYQLWGAEFGTTFAFHKKELSMSCSLKNALNSSYRDYLNRFRYFADEVGRDFQIRIKLTF